MKADTVTKVDINADDASYFNGGLVSFGAGIVETNGVLKENLLTNSGFDVWSNSTLEELDDIITDAWNSVFSGYPTNFATDNNWTASGSSTIADGTNKLLVTLSNGVAASGARLAASHMTSPVAGKLYKLTADVWQNTTAETDFLLYTYDSDGTPTSTETKITIDGSQKNYEHIFEATSDDFDLYIITDGTAADSNSFYIDNAYVYEVTPGCVAGDALAMDGWRKNTDIDLWRQHNDGGTLTHDGSFYSLKTNAATTSNNVHWPVGALEDKPEHYQRFAGRTVTFGAWVKASNASHLKLQITDSTDSTTSDPHTGGGAWEWLEVTRAVSAATTEFKVTIINLVTGVDAYISQPMLVFGSSIGEGNYSRPSGEVIELENGIDSNLLNDTTGWSDSGADLTINLEADSNGKIPKGAAAVRVNGSVNDSGSAAQTAWGGAFMYLYGLDSNAVEYLECRGVTNDAIKDHQVTVKCDANGDIKHQINATGSATFDIPSLRYSAIKLR